MEVTGQVDKGLFQQIADKFYGGDARKAAAEIEGLLKNQKATVIEAKDDLGSYEPTYDLGPRTQAGQLAVNERGQYMQQDVDLAGKLQPYLQAESDRAIERMKGAAGATNIVGKEQGDRRERMLESLLQLERSQNAGRMIDRIIRGVGIAGAMFN